MSLVKGGSLQDTLEQRKSNSKFPFSLQEAATIMKSLLEAVNYIHQRGIVHRDLKLDNLLVKNKDDFSSIKLADFGLSTKIDQGGEGGLSLFNNCGTFLYMSPEIMRNRPYSKPVDIWSSGIIMYTLLTGAHPLYELKDTRETLRAKILCPKWSLPCQVFNSMAKDLFMKLVHIEPSKRYSASQAVMHPWLSQKTGVAVPLTINEIYRLFPTKKNLKSGMILLICMEYLRSHPANVKESKKQLDEFFKKANGQSAIPNDYVLEDQEPDLSFLHRNQKQRGLLPKQAQSKRFLSNDSRILDQLAQTFSHKIHTSFGSQFGSSEERDPYSLNFSPNKSRDIEESTRSLENAKTKGARPKFFHHEIQMRSSFFSNARNSMQKQDSHRLLHREESKESFRSINETLFTGNMTPSNFHKNGRVQNKGNVPFQKKVQSHGNSDEIGSTSSFRNTQRIIETPKTKLKLPPIKKDRKNSLLEEKPQKPLSDLGTVPNRISRSKINSSTSRKEREDLEGPQSATLREPKPSKKLNGLSMSPNKYNQLDSFMPSHSGIQKAKNEKEAAVDHAKLPKTSKYSLKEIVRE